ncbi:hypothetical protein RJ639_047522, partial [Escallonia herrerae]
LAKNKAMAFENVLQMNAGKGDSSYANNSVPQKTSILKTRPLLDDTIKDMFSDSFLECLEIADLGCSSGPNTLLVVSNIIDTVYDLCHEKNHKTPEFHASLNDLPQNDFNTIFKSLPAFYEKLRKKKGDKLGPCFISGVPGSFYSRLFPSKSLHLVYSSNSLHWLSQVPEGVEINKGNIYVAKTSPLFVFDAYLKQFQRDFTTFLQTRAEEVKPDGRMVLAFLGRSITDPTSNDCCCLWDPLAKSLHDMVAEGLVEEVDIDSFNLPIYTPCKDEVKAIIQTEGSFSLSRLENFEVNWDVSEGDDDKHFDKNRSGEMVARSIRAVIEPVIACHFGYVIMDRLFARYAKHVAEHLAVERTKHYNIILSLKRNHCLTRAWSSKTGCFVNLI